jgi:hypothetical protein
MRCGTRQLSPVLLTKGWNIPCNLGVYEREGGREGEREGGRESLHWIWSPYVHVLNDTGVCACACVLHAQADGEICGGNIRFSRFFFLFPKGGYRAEIVNTESGLS